MMKQAITAFLATKKLSPNSVQSYQYDLQQFVAFCEEAVTEGKIRLYQANLSKLSAAAAKRKASAVNQFLYFLYEEGQVDRYYRLRSQQAPTPVTDKRGLEDLSVLKEETSFVEGQVIALLIAELGLTPAELALIKVADIDRDFQVLTIQKGESRRVLSLDGDLLSRLEPHLTGHYLFDKKGQPYSRQWLFKHLSAYTEAIGHRDWTAQALREQYILHRLEAGDSLDAIAKKLGLKSRLSLEKYKHGY